MIGRVGGWMLAGALVILAAHPARAELSAEIVEWGITESRRGPDAPVRPGDSGFLSPSRTQTDVRYVVRTDRIDARLCRSFGITATLASRGGDTLPAQIAVVVRHPRLTRPDGATSEEARFTGDVVAGEIVVGFGFDHDWELQSGVWSIAVAWGGRELARRDFTVSAPNPGAPRSDCERESVS